MAGAQRTLTPVPVAGELRGASCAAPGGSVHGRGPSWPAKAASMARLAARDDARGDHMVHVISPRHFAVIRYAGPHPQASRPARAPHRSAPLLRLPAARQPHHHRAIAAQLLRAAAHIVLLDAHPFRLALDRAATAACAGPLMTPTTPATADADKELPRHAQARTCWSAGPHGRCPCSSAGSSDRTLARTDIWRTGPAAKTTAGHICAGQEPYRRIRTSGL